MTTQEWIGVLIAAVGAVATVVGVWLTHRGPSGHARITLDGASEVEPGVLRVSVANSREFDAEHVTVWLGVEPPVSDKASEWFGHIGPHERASRDITIDRALLSQEGARFWFSWRDGRGEHGPRPSSRTIPTAVAKSRAGDLPKPSVDRLYFIFDRRRDVAFVGTNGHGAILSDHRTALDRPQDLVSGSLTSSGIEIYEVRMSPAEQDHVGQRVREAAEAAQLRNA